jgi:hypothetical protein
LDKGERVLSPAENEAYSGGSMNITINLDGNPILKYLGKASSNGSLTLDAKAIS